MGHVQPDRLFWAHEVGDDDDNPGFDEPDDSFSFEITPNETRH
jgi:hypothetical protein